MTLQGRGQAASRREEEEPQRRGQEHMGYSSVNRAPIGTHLNVKVEGATADMEALVTHARTPW